MPNKKIKRCEDCPYYSSENVNYDLSCPVFSLQYLQKGYRLEEYKEDKIHFFEKMCQLSQLPWKELKQAHRHGLGYEKISRDALNVPVLSFITPDVNFIAFRFSGKAPMIGYRDKNIFHILWFDPVFSVYKHG